MECAAALSSVWIRCVRVEAVSPGLCVRDSHLGGEQSVVPMEVGQPSLPRIPCSVPLLLLLVLQESARGSRVRLLYLRDSVASGLGYYCRVSSSFSRWSLRSDSLVDDLALAALRLLFEVRVWLHSNRLLILECHRSTEALRDVS